MKCSLMLLRLLAVCWLFLGRLLVVSWSFFARLLVVCWSFDVRLQQTTTKLPTNKLPTMGGKSQYYHFCVSASRASLFALSLSALDSTVFWWSVCKLLALLRLPLHLAVLQEQQALLAVEEEVESTAGLPLAFRGLAATSTAKPSKTYTACRNM